MPKILSITGGGVNGLYAAYILHRLEKRLNIEGSIAKHFDLIAGTSTGGLIALALAFEIPASKIVELYSNDAKTIFPASRKNPISKFANYLLGFPLYSSEPLRTKVIELFGEKKLGETDAKLLIPTYNDTAKKVQMFKTPHHDIFQNDKKLCVTDIALATSAAPVFFAPHEINGAQYLDGGIWCNNPVTAAVAEGIEYLNWDRKEISILSLDGPQNIHFQRPSFKKLQSIPSDLIQLHGAGYAAIAKQLISDRNGATGNTGKLVQCAFDVDAGSFALDDTTNQGNLCARAEAHYRKFENEIIERFFDGPSVIPN